MQSQLATILATRKNFIKTLESLTFEQVTRIPTGLNNNIMWHFGHIIASQEILCNRLSGRNGEFPDELVNKYKNGTFPDPNASLEELDLLKKYAISTLENLEKDYNSGVFTTFTERQTMYGPFLTKIEEAVEFNATHEALHFGMVRFFAKVV
jgi:uncharacterized damage-inducible protein DinB